MTKVTIHGTKGDAKGEATLPAVFDTPYRPDVIAKAVKASRANRRQAYGPSAMAGAMHSTASAGKGRGLSRVPRKASDNSGALAPPTVGGRRAHPPTPNKNWSEKVNRQERRLAVKSAIAATKDKDLVVARGHRLGDKVTLPLVVDSSLEKVDKLKDLKAALDALGLGDDLTRAVEGRHVRAGRGKMRGRRFKQPVSLLLVAKDPTNLRRAAGALPGVDVVSPALLSTERLAPGGTAGRLTVWTTAALKEMEATK